MERVERVWHRRLRWRLRGAWQWPAFAVLTVLDGVVLTELPFYDDGPGGVFPGALLAGVANLLAVALLAPPLGRAVRRRRPDLPRLVAADYAGAWLLAGIAALLVIGGLAHRPARAAQAADAGAVVRAMHTYVLNQAPEYRDRLAAVDAIRIDEELYRACVPGEDARHSLCLFVRTDQRPAGVRRDSEEIPNREYRYRGGPR